MKKFFLEYYEDHPHMTLQDVEKALYQSVFGCRHLLTDIGRVEDGIRLEMKLMKDQELLTDLPGNYTRVHLHYLELMELSPTTLTKLFMLSAQREDGSVEELGQRIEAVKVLCREGKLPFAEEDATWSFAVWKMQGYPPRRHSEEYRASYHPAYRVIAKKYVVLLPLLCAIENHLQRQCRITIAIDGGAGSGKTTLANLLRELYGAAVVHMDDFFLRPEQRTPSRYAEAGGNVDRERFLNEVLLPLHYGNEVSYCPFDCHTLQLKSEVQLPKNRVTVVEGTYSMHPDLAPYYDTSVFLNIESEEQLRRIKVRDGEEYAKIFKDRWIPMENNYFITTRTSARCAMRLEACI